MMLPRTCDLDYVGALIHARRSKMAEGERLERLCLLQNLGELGEAVLPGSSFDDTAAFQRHLVRALALEINEILMHLRGSGAALTEWLLERFEFENVKVMIRAVLNQIPFQRFQKHLVLLPHNRKRWLEIAPRTRTLNDLMALLPAGLDTRRVRRAWSDPPVASQPFFFEATLDSMYFRQLIAHTRQLQGEDRELIEPLVRQEADAFQLMLALRGRFHYGLAPALLLPLRVEGSGISPERFTAMLGAPDAAAAASHVAWWVMDGNHAAGKTGAASEQNVMTTCEAIARGNCHQLANRAFRRGHMALGQLVGYVFLRRVETENLITLSEAIRMGVAPTAIRDRLVPRPGREVSHV
jgi:vacuolar-type H+-ATPase subunit C/Vma6